MKKLKILNILLIIVSIVLLLLIYFKKSKTPKGLAFGNEINYSYQEFKKCNKSFLCNESCFELYNMLNNNVSKVDNGKVKTINSIIKKSDYIILQLGYVDIAKHIKVNNYTNTLSYDEDILNREKDVILSFYNNTIKKIYQINKKISIYVLEIVNNYNLEDNFIDSYFSSINENLEEICQINGCFFFLINNN